MPAPGLPAQPAPWPCPVAGRGIPGCCRVRQGCFTSLNLLQGNVLSRAARWTGSSAGSFLLFWCSLRLSSIASPAALPLCGERSSWDPPSGLRAPPPQVPPPPGSHSPWPGAGPGAPVGLGVSLEALESSLAGAGVGIIPDGEVGLQPGDAGAGTEGQSP